MNWTELNWTVNFQIGWTWTVNFYWTELNFLNWTARMCELLLWTGFGLNCELLVEKHVKVIFCGEENVKKWFWGFFRAILPDCWVQTQNLENEFRYVKFGIDENKRRTDLEKVWFSWTEVIFKTVHNSVQFSTIQFSSQFTWTVAKFNSSGQLGIYLLAAWFN